MKKTIFLLALIALSFSLKAQYSFTVATGPGLSPVFNYVYVGSLNRQPINGANSQKLQIDIMGAGWFNDTKGITTFYIANRGGLTINQVTQGGAAFGGSVLKAYQNGDNTDFYLAINSSADYCTFAINAYTFGYAISSGPVTITTQTAIPTGTDITSSLNINPVMITDAGGNIGFNTASPDPTYKLAVNGNIRAKEVKVETGWSDYVFYPTYKLKPLSEVATYIKTNQHLPDVPSAAEVEKNGINVGETNALLLKKIEELTLYLIEKDKEIKKLEQQQITKQAQIKQQTANQSQQQIQINEMKKQIEQLSKLIKLQ